MSIELYETHELIGVVENTQPISTYFLDLLFNRVHTSDSEYIDFDVLDKGKRLAPFVVPHVQGQPMLQRGYETRKFKPAYSKQKDAIDPRRSIMRRPGEKLGGELSPGQRMDAVIVETQKDHYENLIRTWEWLAAQAVIFGQVTLEGENYPTTTVQFGRDVANTITPAVLWSNAATARPLDDIKAAAQRIKNAGKQARRITMSPDAAAAFFATDQVKAEFESRRGTSMGQTIEKNAGLNGDEAVYYGTLPGGIEVWELSATYEDNLGDEQPYLPAGTAVLTGDIEGVRAFGAIMDDKAQWQALPVFPKMFTVPDPAGVFLLTQSAPLMVPLRPNASVLLNVL